MKPTIAVDLAKSVFEVAISQRPGRVTQRLRLSRKRLLPFFAQQPQAQFFSRPAPRLTSGPVSSETSATTRFFYHLDAFAPTGKGKALTLLAHKLGRTVYYMLSRGKTFDQNKFLAA